MIDAAELWELIHAEPFQSFHVYMADGHDYEVSNPDLAVPMESMLFVALPRNRWKFLSYAMITRVEGGEVAA